MTYSKIHKRFSERLNNPEALTNPEKYLGPNWEDVLNFWIYVETLSDEEKNEMGQRYWALDYIVRDYAMNAARRAADAVVGWDFRVEAFDAAYEVTGWGVFSYATDKLIGHHKLIEQNKLLTALQCCVK